MSKAQDLQYIVFWSIIGPVALVLSLFAFSAVLLAFAPPQSDSWVTALGVLLHYNSLFGLVIAAPVVAFFGLLGLVLLPRRSFRRKALTLCVCAAAFAVPTATVVAMYFG
ncbi:hypothetical protein C1O66_18040 [Paucibacter aquatile]|uniref:Uncharacterized protein n=1 Tax=Kinneretia aquatilis TaxID=2070761 RepID=A0A2N8L0K5_9BURK|nr:hypothetical protein C1O66_04110 [Paucibacter aquatile]PND39240.1 hypothetical protein C1O66_18040 [Paucibacter aquatile]